MVAGSIPAEGKYFIFIFLYFYLGSILRAAHRLRPLPPWTPAALRSIHRTAPHRTAAPSTLYALRSTATATATALCCALRWPAGRLAGHAIDPGLLPCIVLSCNGLTP